MKIILGVYDKASNVYDKFFLIDDSEFNNFLKSLRMIVNNDSDVYSLYCDDYELNKLGTLNESGLDVLKNCNYILSFSSLKEVKHE